MSLAIVALALQFAPASTIDRVDTLFNDRTEDNALVERSELARVAIDVAADTPLTGVGLGSFEAESDERIGIRKPAHNTWLGTAAQTGLIGLLLLAAPTVRTIRRAVAASAGDVRYLAAAPAFIGVVGGLTLTLEYKKLHWLALVTSMLVVELVIDIRRR